MIAVGEIVALVGKLPGPVLRERIRQFMSDPLATLDLSWAEVMDLEVFMRLCESSEVLIEDGEAGVRLTHRNEAAEKRTEDNIK